MAIYPSGTPSDADLYVAFDNFSTTLNGAIDNVQTTITLTSTVGLPTVGILTIESEKVKYTGIAGNDITGVTRGFSATTAASHLTGTFVAFNVVEEHHNANKDEIIAVATDLRSTFTADLNDAVAPALTASNILDRLNQIATQIKAINTGSDWKDAITIPLTGLVALNGTRAFTANQPMGGFKLTGLAAGTTNGDSLRYEQVIGVYALDAAVVHLAGSETITGQKTFSLAILHADGTAALPGLAFSADLDTGIYRIGADSIGITTAGVVKITVDSGGTSTFVESIREKDGSTASPSYTFSNDTDSGIYRPTTDQVGIVAGATNIATFILSAGLALSRFGDGTSALPGIAFSNDGDTGLSRPASNQLDINAAGARVARFDGASGNIRANLSSAASPSYSFESDQDTGMYGTGTDNIGFTTAGIVRMFVGTGSISTVLPFTVSPATGSIAITINNLTTDDTERNEVNTSGSGAAQHIIAMYTTTSLTTAKTIGKANNYCDLFLVAGRNNADTAHFGDLILTGFTTATINVISSSGAATVRTYSKTGSNQDVKVALAADTWTIDTMKLEAANR